MNICFDGLKGGQVCIGDVTAQLHGTEWGMTHTGILMLGIILVAVIIFVFRNPA